MILVTTAIFRVRPVEYRENALISGNVTGKAAITAIPPIVASLP